MSDGRVGAPMSHHVLPTRVCYTVYFLVPFLYSRVGIKKGEIEGEIDVNFRNSNFVPFLTFSLYSCPVWWSPGRHAF